tara:strand:+ start:608 stop:1912 length:1305 start_codon:yes stop_codon:yes gene_type:complete
MKKSIVLEKIESKEAKIGVIGLGYVGLPLALTFAEEDLVTIGFDIDPSKIKMINNSKSYIQHISSERIDKAKKNGFTTTIDFSEIKNIDIIIICVPTPLGVHNEPDLSYIRGTLKSISKFLRKNQLLILESTTYPGTTEEEIIPVIENLKFIIGEDFFVGYSPEREDPGNKVFTTKTIPKIVSGHTPSCLEATNQLYSEIIDTTVKVSSTKIAEMAKILENIHRAVNIGLMNELKVLSEKMDIDIYEVIKAAATKPFGFTPYYPGPGLGGHCIPIDPFYLTWKAKEIGMNTRFIELAGEINTSMPAYVFQKVYEALNSKGKPISGSKILVLGLSYKKNIDDLRESPSLQIIQFLIENGSKVFYSDPYFEKIPKTRKYNFDLSNTSINPKLLKTMDLVILATDHDKFDYDSIVKYSELIVDTRGRYKKSSKVFKA